MRHYRAEAEASPLHAPPHGNLDAGRDGKPSGNRGAGKHDLSVEHGNAEAGNANRSTAGGDPLETRRHVEEKVEYFKDMARKCDEEVRYPASCPSSREGQ